MKSIPEIDLSRMLESPKCAVICRSLEEVEIFYINASKQLSAYIPWDFDDIQMLWSTYKGNTGFTLFVSRNEPESVSYCNEGWFKAEGYELIELSDITPFLEIMESELSFDILFR